MKEALFGCKNIISFLALKGQYASLTNYPRQQLNLFYHLFAAMHIFYLHIVKVQNREGLIKQLNNAGIQTSMHYSCIFPLPPAYIYLHHKAVQFPVSFSCRDKILSLPIFTELTAEQIKFFASEIRNFYKTSR